MVSDLLLDHPSAETLHILPTTRDPSTHLALSSRNAYLSPSELAVAPILYQALTAAKETWKQGNTTGEDIIAAATATVLQKQSELEDTPERVELKMDYFEVFDRHTFEPIRGKVQSGRELVVAGAVWVGGTRLIDNFLLGWEVE